MKKFALFILGLSVFFVGCKSADALKGNWEISSLVVDGVAQNIVDSNIEFDFSGTETTVNGCSGINLYHGVVDVKNGKFKASENFASTKMMGDPAADEFEVMFLETLMNATKYSVNDNVLTISAPAKKMELKFKRAR